MQILKFGGSSIADAKKCRGVIDIIHSEKVDNEPLTVVFSALGGITDLIIDAAKLAVVGDNSYKELLRVCESRHIDLVNDLIPIVNRSPILTQVKMKCNDMEDLLNGIYLLRELSAKTLDTILSFGEWLSSKILSVQLAVSGFNVLWKNSTELIRTDSTFNAAKVDFEITTKLVKDFYNSNVSDYVILPGFVASDHEGFTTTLGRGGSDYTAAIIGACINAELIQIWTDVSGLMTADPKLVNAAKVIDDISYEEAMELCHFGAKIIYPPTLQPSMDKDIPVLIKNTFAPQNQGTIIHRKAHRTPNSIRGISTIRKIALLTLEGAGMVGTPGFSKRLFEILADNKINIIFITQGSSEHSICVGVEQNAAQKGKLSVDECFRSEIKTGLVRPLIIENDLSIIALVGDSMKSHPGVSGKMFSILGRNGINVRAIAQGSSERNISAVVAESDVNKTLNVLHEAFFETSLKQVNLFICGTGNVGSKLLGQLHKQYDYLLKQLRVNVRLVAIANSRTMIFNNDGIDMNDWKKELSSGQPMDLEEFVRLIIDKNLRNSIFVDVTANENVSGIYGDLLSRSISVVACNKIACSSKYSEYIRLKDLATEFNTSFLFETNVGAGLPIIGTLNDLIKSGDKVNRIEAVLSGTLNYVFNNYNGGLSFAQIVRNAQNEGYTEPDPRLDLSGKDVMRKILILARESGYPLEVADIQNNSFMPAECMKGNVESFYAEMENFEQHFKLMYSSANAKNKKLKFVASFCDGKASVGLQEIGVDHDLYHLYGKDNIILFYTNRYIDQPLVIKGAGAGADVTASGVFADIIRSVASSN
ncbi:MAG: bifunctional aspartate kinase/homoserine dehydrogenase I [Ginsengibacter sp.]